jgi:hypothetical protein
MNFFEIDTARSYIETFNHRLFLVFGSLNHAVGCFRIWLLELLFELDDLLDLFEVNFMLLSSCSQAGRLVEKHMRSCIQIVHSGHFPLDFVFVSTWEASLGFEALRRSASFISTVVLLHNSLKIVHYCV